jgi:2-aminomuconate deaminase
MDIHSSKAPKAVGAYPHAKRVGDFLFLSGIGSRNPKDNSIAGLELSATGEILNYDFEAQVHQVMQNVKEVLESAGAKWENLVDVTVFLIDMKRDFATFNRIYAEYFTTVQPCRTTLAVTALPTPIAIELKCVAYLGNDVV